MSHYEVLSQRIKDCCIDNDIEQKELSEYCISQGVKCSEATISDICNGKKDKGYSYQIIRCIAEKLKVSADYLLGLSDAPTNNKDDAFITDYLGLSVDSIKHLYILKLLSDDKIKYINKDYKETLDFINLLLADEFFDRLSKIGGLKCSIIDYISFTTRQYNNVITASENNNIEELFDFNNAEENAKSIYVSLYEISEIFKEIQSAYIGEVFDEWKKTQQKAKKCFDNYFINKDGESNGNNTET